MAAGSRNEKNAWKLVHTMVYDVDGMLLYTRALNTATGVALRYNLMSCYGATEIVTILGSTWVKIRMGIVSVQAAIQEITRRFKLFWTRANASE